MTLGVGSAINRLLPNPQAPQNDPNQGANDDALIRQRYNQMADEYSSGATSLRAKLAQNLAQTGQETFQQANPFILEDLNARGLSTSPTAVGAEQARALAELTTQNNRALSDFDTDVFGNVQSLRQTGSAQGVQRTFDLADASREEAMAKYLAKKQSRTALISALIGAAGTSGGAALGRG